MLFNPEEGLLISLITRSSFFEHFTRIKLTTRKTKCDECYQKVLLCTYFIYLKHPLLLVQQDSARGKVFLINETFIEFVSTFGFLGESECIYFLIPRSRSGSPPG